MIDCTKTEDFFKEVHRLCDSFGCASCPLSKYNNDDAISLCPDVIDSKNVCKAITIVQKWSNEHPQKTFLDDFKEKYPNAKFYEDGTPRACVCSLGYITNTECPKKDDGFNMHCVECWNRPVEEEKK